MSNHYPDHYKYTKDHEWVNLQADGTALIGITAHAIEQLGDVVYLELPQVGFNLEAQQPFGTIESTKTVSDLFSPVSGIVLDTNTSLVQAPENLMVDPFEQGWLIKVKTQKVSDDLMDLEQYRAYAGMAKKE